MRRLTELQWKLKWENNNDQLPVGLITQLVEKVQCNRMAMGLNPVHRAWIYFKLLLTSDQLLVGLITQLVEQVQCNRMAMCSNPIQAWIF